MLYKLTVGLHPFQACHMLRASQDHLKPDMPHQVPYMCTITTHISKRNATKVGNRQYYVFY